MTGRATAWELPTAELDRTVGRSLLGPLDTINGPVFSNDSIYVTDEASSGPNFGAASPWASVSARSELHIHQSQLPSLRLDGRWGIRAPPASADNQPHQTPPADDTSLAQVTMATNNGCVYYGPTAGSH